MQTLQGIDSEYVYLEDEDEVLTPGEYAAWLKLSDWDKDVIRRKRRESVHSLRWRDGEWLPLQRADAALRTPQRGNKMYLIVLAVDSDVPLVDLRSLREDQFIAHAICKPTQDDLSHPDFSGRFLEPLAAPVLNTMRARGQSPTPGMPSPR